MPAHRIPQVYLTIPSFDWPIRYMDIAASGVDYPEDS